MTIFYILLGVGIIVFIIYFFSTMAMADNLNKFLENWIDRTLWIWLPFYGFRRLIRDLFLRKK